MRGAGSGGTCVQWGGVVMGVGAGTHTLLCVYVGVAVSQGVCILCGQGCVGRKCVLVGGERAAVMCRGEGGCCAVSTG